MQPNKIKDYANEAKADAEAARNAVNQIAEHNTAAFARAHRLALIAEWNAEAWESICRGMIDFDSKPQRLLNSASKNHGGSLYHQYKSWLASGSSRESGQGEAQVAVRSYRDGWENTCLKEQFHPLFTPEELEAMEVWQRNGTVEPTIPQILADQRSNEAA